MVVFRVDSSSRIGAGHAYRCLHLASRLRLEGVCVHFICRAHSNSLVDLIRERGFDVIELPLRVQSEFAKDSDYAGWLGASMQDEIVDFRAALSVFGKFVKWVVVDHYSLGAEWHRAVRPFAKYLMAIDDLANRHYDVDLFVDHSGNDTVPSRYRDLLPESCRRLLGPSFAIVNPDFETIDRMGVDGKSGVINQVFVSFGGYDPCGEVIKAARALQHFDVEVDFAVGRSSFGIDQLRGFCEVESRFRLHVQSSDMVRLMLRADLAIGAAGTSAWERCLAGLPSIVCVLADNQRRAGQDLVSSGAARSVGFHRSSDTNSYVELLKVLTTEPQTVRGMAQKARSLIDGLGTERVVASMLRL